MTPVPTMPALYALLCRTVKEFVAPQCAAMKTAVQKQLQTFGANVRRLRNEKELTQEKLAELADLNIRTIQKIEAGQTNILVTTAARIQKALGCGWGELMSF
jgi:DNA-binding XRE family transcriptional regulator